MYYELYLPFPPTVNNYYKKSKSGGRFISEKGRRFRQDVVEAISEQIGSSVPLDDRLLVEVILFPPDNRARDVDNYNKALLDAITESGFWMDDKLVDQLFVYRGEVRSRRGSCYVRVSEAAPILKSVAQLPED
jgi:crossover junction endodeoxyribonuclease RusA